MLPKSQESNEKRLTFFVHVWTVIKMNQRRRHPSFRRPKFLFSTKNTWPYYCDKYQFPTSIIVFIAYNLQWFKLNKIWYALLTGTHFYISIFLAHNICLYSGNSNDLCILLILLVRETRWSRHIQTEECFHFRNKRKKRERYRTWCRAGLEIRMSCHFMRINIEKLKKKSKREKTIKESQDVVCL